MKFEALENQDLVSRVAATLSNAIVTGQMSPGAKLNEVRLSEQFQISRAPLREALRKLESQGLVESHPRRGFFLPRSDISQTRDLFEVRIALEVTAGRCVAAAQDENIISDLIHQYENIRIAAKSGNSQAVTEEDFKFHRLVCQLSGNKKLLQIFDQISGEIRFAIAHVRGFHSDLVALATSHEPLVQALQDGDGDAYAASLRVHLGEARDKIIRAHERGDYG